MEILKEHNFKKIAENIKPDAKKRVVLPKPVVSEGVLYNIYSNESGQIVLDPQVTIPASEAWIYENAEVLALIREGLDDAAAGRVYDADINRL